MIETVFTCIAPALDPYLVMLAQASTHGGARILYAGLAGRWMRAQLIGYRDKSLPAFAPWFGGLAGAGAPPVLHRQSLSSSRCPAWQNGPQNRGISTRIPDLLVQRVKTEQRADSVSPRGLQSGCGR
jgi:hypothetical protein